MRGVVIVCLVLALVPLVTSVVDVAVIDQTIQSSALMGYFPKDFAIADIIAKAFL